MACTYLNRTCRLRNNSILYINKSKQVGALAVRFNKFITSVGYLTARENEIELLTTKFYSLHIVSVKEFHHNSL